MSYQLLISYYHDGPLDLVFAVDSSMVARWDERAQFHVSLKAVMSLI